MTLSLIYGESSPYSPKFKYHFTVPGFTNTFASPPKGFTRAYQQSNNPLSVNFPNWFTEVQVEQSSSDSGNVMVIAEKIGTKALYTPRYIPFSEYYVYKKNYDLDKMWYDHVALTDSTFYLDQKANQQQSGSQSLEIIGADIAGQRVALRIRGLISITGKYNQQNNTILATGNMENEQKNFLMDQTQQFTIEGTIGDRITISIDEDSERDFQFENAIKINYKGKEDEIVQSANFGNIGLSLPGTQFVTGSSSSSGLFGGKAVMKLGPVDLTAIASYEKKDSKKKSWGGGSGEDAGSTVQIFAYEYKRNTYYYINEDYRESFYPLDGQGLHNISSGDRIIEYKLFVSCNETELSKIKAIAYVDLASDGTATAVTSHPEEDVASSIYFKELTPTTDDNPYGDYILYQDLGYLKMNMSTSDQQVLAIAYKTKDGRVYGDLSTGSYLKIIKAENPKPSYITWDLEMKNIYDLKARSIDEEGFDLKVYYNGENQPKEYDARGLSYLRNFGLDNFTQNGTVGHDGKIDLKANIVKLSEGELWIPYVLPFEAPSEGNTSSGVYNDSLDFTDGSDRPSIDEIYNLSYTDPLRKSLDYYIEVKYSNRSSTIDLGEMFIIEGSEEILVNGAKMEKGIDYDIDYFSGLITLKSVRAMDANAKIDINYETEQLFGGIGEQKLMAGLRAEYRINEKAFIGATAMYYDRSVLDDKNVNIGDEPFKNFIWDVNGEFEYDLNWLDRAMNALPFIRIRKASRMKLSGEIAQILPNPNTIENEESGDFDGVAKLDDFESASQETPMNINFQKWTHASKPENTFFASTFTERGFLFWYNPFYVGANGAKVFGIYTKNIWPQKETTESDQYTSVLNVVLDPTVNGITGHETESDTRQVWGGIMQPVYMYDQSNSKYIELWVKGEKGQLQIDIGEITEDWYNTNYDVSFPESELGDGEKNYEDKDNNGSLESTTYYNEDIGINGLTDEEEIARGWDPMIDNFDKEGYKVGEVRYCNGSENNAGTDGIQPYPETEDIDRDGKLDQANSYYSYTLDLSSEEWLASRTYYDGNSGATGWKKYLIPLTAMIDSVGKPSFTSIRMMRLNMFGVEDQDTLQIAGISIVGNEWQELGLASDDEPFYKKDDDRFYITVKNTDEDDDYQSPPGIEGREQVNPFGGETIREKEQALVLNLVGFQPGETALAEKIMLSSESLLMYKKLKMFVHGDDNITDENSPLNVFLRIGRGDMTEYYEAVTSVYSGWEDKNNIEIVFDQITRLKNRVDFDGIEYFSYDKGFIKEYRPIDITTGEYTGKIYRVVGDPTLSRIEKMQLGVINVDPFINYTGEIWVNEMRVVESNNDPGMAMRGNFDFSLGDFMNFNINAKKMDADFRQVNQQMSSNTNSSEALNMSMTLKAHKLFPDKWKLSIPITMSQTQSEYTPKYFPGSDILLGDDPDDSLITRSTNQSISTSIGRSGTNTDNALMKYFINPISAKVSMAKAMNTTLETLSSENTSTSGNFQYNLSIPKGKGIPYLSWIPFLSDKAKEEKFYLTPTSFKWNMSIAEAEREWITRSTLDTNNTYSFYMNKGMSLNYSPFESMKFTYSRDSKADLYDYRFDKWKLFSDISYDSLMNGVNVGDVTNMSENTGLTYNPILTSWLKPRLSYSSVYKYNSSKNVNYATVGVTRTISGSLTLSLKQIWDTYEKQFQDMNKRRQNAAPKPNLNQIPKREDDRDFAKKDMAPDTRPKAKTTVSKKSKPFSVSNLLAKIDPISLSYSNNFSKGNSGITGSDSTKIYKNVVYKYRYGLVDYYSLPTGSFENTILRPMTNSLKEQISIGSGIKLTKTISLKLNYKQNTSSGRDYTYKTNAGAFYDEPTHIVVYGDTLELSPYDSSASRNYIPLGETGKDGFVAPDYSLNWSITPSQFKWLKGKLDFIKKISLQHQMSGKESIRYIQRTDRFPYYMESTSSTYNLNFTPLIKAGFIFTGNLRADFAYNKTIKIDHSGDVELDYFNTGIVRTYQDNITFNMSYEYNKGLSIPVPFLKNVQVLNLNNEITFSLQGKYGLNKVIVKQKASEVFDSPRDYMITWEVEPQVSYRFSKNIDGRFFFKYGQRIDMKQSGAIEGENKYDDYKDFGVTVTIRISG